MSSIFDSSENVIHLGYFLLGGTHIGIISLWCRHISWLLGLRWNIHGIHKLDNKKSFIMVANHQSSLDLLGMFEIIHYLQFPMTIMTRLRVILISPLGLAMWLSGIVLLKPQQTMSDLKTNIYGRDNINNNMIMWNFPEIKTGIGDKIQKFDKHAFSFAIEDDLPIVPVVFGSYKKIFDDDQKYFNTGYVNITILPEIRTENLYREDVNDLIKSVKTTMIKQTNEDL
ncbi:1-acyl-sn-glycerol-3-phosphate acyltransferase alpha-like [Ctenocephalides felis]|uniref:1-acyl-sn-glycerol-3-phosphate acyltransferase alpha-like n=1 Tax=Ctenocephalides felis TaxID=7515 RepID=UPI000E6E5B91|nr:1-acyl-sn-glycerol-3-phosphate acyltransferase alpha-like [Ctenocephalides felis]